MNYHFDHHSGGGEAPFSPDNDIIRRMPNPNLRTAAWLLSHRFGLHLKSVTDDRFSFGVWAAEENYNALPGPRYDDAVPLDRMIALREFLKSLAGDGFHNEIQRALRYGGETLKDRIFGAVAGVLDPVMTNDPEADLLAAIDPSRWRIEAVEAHGKRERALRLTAFVSGMICQERAMENLGSQIEGQKHLRQYLGVLRSLRDLTSSTDRDSPPTASKTRSSKFRDTAARLLPRCFG